MDKFDYKEPNWFLTCCMEALYLSGIYHLKKALTHEQMIYALGENPLNSTLLLNTMVDGGFLKGEGRMYYLSELGVHHAKKRLGTFEEVLREHKEGKYQDFQLRSILNARYKVLDRINDVLKPAESTLPRDRTGRKPAPTRTEFEKLEKRVEELEKRIEKLKSL
jgi:hypothetical protein